VQSLTELLELLILHPHGLLPLKGGRQLLYLHLVRMSIQRVLLYLVKSEWRRCYLTLNSYRLSASR
jgi:hypothetical protein